jgi:hypothetical protein
VDVYFPLVFYHNPHKRELILRGRSTEAISPSDYPFLEPHQQLFDEKHTLFSGIGQFSPLFAI